MSNIAGSIQPLGICARLRNSPFKLVGFQDGFGGNKTSVSSEVCRVLRQI